MNGNVPGGSEYENPPWKEEPLEKRKFVIGITVVEETEVELSVDKNGDYSQDQVNDIVIGLAKDRILIDVDVQEI